MVFLDAAVAANFITILKLSIKLHNDLGGHASGRLVFEFSDPASRNSDGVSSALREPIPRFGGRSGSTGVARWSRVSHDDYVDGLTVLNWLAGRATQSRFASWTLLLTTLGFIPILHCRAGSVFLSISHFNFLASQCLFPGLMHLPVSQSTSNSPKSLMLQAERISLSQPRHPQLPPYVIDIADYSGHQLADPGLRTLPMHFLSSITSRKLIQSSQFPASHPPDAAQAVDKVMTKIRAALLCRG